MLKLLGIVFVIWLLVAWLVARLFGEFCVVGRGGGEDIGE